MTRYAINNQELNQLKKILIDAIHESYQVDNDTIRYSYLEDMFSEFFNENNIIDDNRSTWNTKQTKQ